MHNTQQEQKQDAADNNQLDIADWTALKYGNKKAFRKIYEAHIEALLQYGKRFSRDSQTVEDCVHDLFVDLWRRREGLGMTDSIRRYLLVCLRRSIIKQTGRSSKTEDFVIDGGQDIMFTGSVENEIINEEQVQEDQSQLSHAMAKLSARQQEAIYLKYHKNLAYEDVAEIMDINYQSVRNLVFNGISKMRTLMTTIGTGISYISVYLMN